MSKAYIAQIAFAALPAMMLIPLTIEIFGEFDPGRMKVIGGLLMTGMVGYLVCALIHVSKGKETDHE